MEKRQPKPRKVFSPDLHVVKTRKGVKIEDKIDGRISRNRDKRSRNVVADEGTFNKWFVYQQRITKILAVLRTQTHFADVMMQQKRERTTVSSAAEREVTEVTRCLDKIGAAKCSIISLFQEIAAENKEDRIFPQLEADADESGLIDVEEVVCSLCGKDDEEGNDVLLCDRTGCCRAYHQKCLDPAVIISEDNDPDADWFCWQCECIDDCLDLVNEQCETEHNSWEELFPELTEERAAAFGGLASDDSDDDEEDDDYNPEADRMDNECENISEVGYDTDELSYDGIEEGDEEAPGVSLRLFGDSSPGDMYDEEVEVRERGMVLEEDSDLECDIDTDEIGQLLDEAGDPLVESVTVAGRRLRPRSSKETVRDLAYTVEGAADVGKSVLKVKRGIAIMGKVTAYISGPQGMLHAVTNGSIDAASSSSSSSSSSCFSELDHVLKTESSGGSEHTRDIQAEAGTGPVVGATAENPPNLPTTEVPVKAISDVADGVAVSIPVLPALMVTSHNDGTRETAPDQSEPPDAVEGSRPGIPEATEGNSAAESDMEIPVVGKDESPVLDTDIEGPVTALWHVLYDDGSEATLTHSELSKALLDAKEHIKLLKKATRTALSKDAKDLIAAKGVLDASNVLQHKRSRKTIDYASLSLQMFGTVVDDDPEANEEVDAEEFTREEEEDNQPKRRKKKKAKEEGSAKKPAPDAPFVFDHVLFQSNPRPVMDQTDLI